MDYGKDNVASAKLEYLRRSKLYETEKPFRIYYEIPESSKDKRRTNLEFEEQNVEIHDLRTSKPLDSYMLDRNGFAIIPFKTAFPMQLFNDRYEVERLFLPQVEAVLRSKIPNIEALYLFDWRLRSAAPYAGPEMIDLNDPTSYVRPAQQVHVDQSASAVLHRIQLHAGKDAARLLQHRVRVINLWRPLHGPVLDYPLAVCDGSTVPREDLAECDQIRKKYFGATDYVHYRPSHKWYYLSNMQPDEAFLMKIFDSKTNVEAPYCPHSSFKHPACPDNAPFRVSIEIRALVFTAD